MTRYVKKKTGDALFLECRKPGKMIRDLILWRVLQNDVKQFGIYLESIEEPLKILRII